MRHPRFLLRLVFPCVLLGAGLARPADAQAELPASPEAVPDTTAQDSSFFDADVADGHKPRRRGMRPATATRPAVPAPASVAPAVSTATAPGAPPEAALPPGHVVLAPLPPQPERPGSTYEAAPVTLSAIAADEPGSTSDPEPPATEAPLAPEDAERAVADASEAEDVLDPAIAPEANAADEVPLVAELPAAPLAPNVEPASATEAPAPVSVPAPNPDEATQPMVTPGVDAPEAAPSLFDTHIAAGHKPLADVPPPTFFDTRIASGHKDLAERDDLMFDFRVAEGHKVLPLPEPLAEFESALGITAAGHFVVSPEGMDYVLAEAVRVGRLFNTSGKRRRAYFPMIETALARRGLPQELKYLALIESSMDPLAVSHAGARGLWQIMPETAGDFGADSMAVHDPKVATRIAVQYLERLHRMFDGDWLLAIAAYNSGPGRVQGFVRQFERAQGRPPTFWEIRSRLPRETRDYVPRFLAAIFYAQSDV